MQLSDQGETFSEGEAQKILVRKAPVRPGLMGLGLQPDDQEGSACWERYRQAQLEKLSEPELLEKCKKSSIYDWQPELSLYKAYFKKHLEYLRENLSNGFRSAVEKKNKRIIDELGSGYALPDSMVNTLRLRVIRQALKIFCARAEAADLKLVRRVLDSDLDINYEPIVIQYLGRCGSWQDVSRVIRLSENPDYSGRSSLLIGFHAEEYHLAAAAICRLGRRQVGDILSLKMPISVLTNVVAQMSPSSFSALPNDVIMDLVDKENDLWRKTLALKCVAALTRNIVAIK
jgi:hypothetical protein